MKYFLVLLISIIGPTIFSAPHPTTGQSLLNRLSHSPVFSQFGFQLKGSVELPWIMDNSQDDAKEFNLLYGSGRLNIKSDVVPVKTELDNYIKRFLKDYNHYGFSISKIQNGSDETTPQITLDIEQKNKKNKLKQFFILKNQHVLTITCSDNNESFERTSHLCQRFVDEISWL